MKKKTEWITSAESAARLESDPVWVAERDKRQAEFEKRAAELRHAEAPLVDELRAAGFQVQSVWDLVNTPGSYPKAMPILLAHLPKPYPAAIREGIARALAVPETKALGWDMLLRRFREDQEYRSKEGLAAAIAATADDEVLDDVLALLRDTSQGPTRVLLLGALEKSKDPRAYATLVELANDPDLYKEIKIILKRLDRKMERKRARLMERKQKMH